MIDKIINVDATGKVSVDSTREPNPNTTISDAIGGDLVTFQQMLRNKVSKAWDILETGRGDLYNAKDLHPFLVPAFEAAITAMRNLWKAADRAMLSRPT